MGAPFWETLKSITLNDGAEPPPLMPDGASDEYAAARAELVDAELALREHVLEVARKRRALPRGAAVENYELSEGVTLLDLFGEHDTLLVYHLMFHPDDDAACPMCSMWVDGLNGAALHIEQSTAFAVIGKAPLPKLRAWGERRGWDRARLVSSHDSPFNADMGMEGPKGGQWPGVSVFERDGEGGIRHVFTQTALTPSGGLDQLSPVWHALDLLPQGRRDWMADNDYVLGH